MSYMLTAIHLYGVSLAYEEARRVLAHAGNLGFLQECERQFASLAEEFGQLDALDLQLYHADLQGGLPVSDYPYKQFATLVDFFDYFGFSHYQVPPQDMDIIPTVYNERRGTQYHRHRYYADLFCQDADSRGDSLRLLPGKQSVYGIYIASSGYAYNDDVRVFDKDPRIEGNFRKYCAPVLQELGLSRAVERVLIYQTW
jgi:hypothetical protein